MPEEKSYSGKGGIKKWNSEVVYLRTREADRLQPQSVGLSSLVLDRRCTCKAKWHSAKTVSQQMIHDTDKVKRPCSMNQRLQLMMTRLEHKHLYLQVNFFAVTLNAQKYLNTCEEDLDVMNLLNSLYSTIWICKC